MVLEAMIRRSLLQRGFFVRVFSRGGQKKKVSTGTWLPSLPVSRCQTCTSCPSSPLHSVSMSPSAGARVHVLLFRDASSLRVQAPSDCGNWDLQLSVHSTGHGPHPKYVCLHMQQGHRQSRHKNQTATPRREAWPKRLPRHAPNGCWILRHRIKVDNRPNELKRALTHIWILASHGRAAHGPDLLTLRLHCFKMDTWF